ncbi:hypothetical protein BHM03_00062525, partial [Ensete ventricosum]
FGLHLKKIGSGHRWTSKKRTQVLGRSQVRASGRGSDDAVGTRWKIVGSSLKELAKGDQELAENGQGFAKRCRGSPRVRRRLLGRLPGRR